VRRVDEELAEKAWGHQLRRVVKEGARQRAAGKTPSRRVRAPLRD
jgi:hypothetical protein